MIRIYGMNGSLLAQRMADLDQQKLAGFVQVLLKALLPAHIIRARACNDSTSARQERAATAADSDSTI